MAFDRLGDENAGFALVAILVFMLIVSAVVVPFALTARTRLMIATNEVEQQRLSLVAEGLTNVVSTELFEDSVASLRTVKARLNGEPVECRSGQLTISLTIQDHNGLIDLNAANDQLLAQGIASFGFDDQTAASLAKAIIIYRGPPDAFAQAAQGQSSIGPADNKFAPFESISELQEYPAFASVPLHALFGVFTVNLGRGAVVLAVAPRRLRDFVNTISGTYQPSETNDGSVYTVEATVSRDGSGIVGQAGFTVEKSLSGAKGFHRLAQMPAASVVGSIDDMLPVSTFGCDILFGTAVAQILGQWK
ncbi:general secretion pathway protein GspK [Mesorhizobium australicum]|uniref:hypothetical protein n=1 Tax=Mesorhizobium australicum TaxID=536018 RepID=UPI00333DF840